MDDYREGELKIMDKTPLLERVEEDLKHNKNMINGLRGEITEIELNIKYYEGRIDSLQEVLEAINQTVIPP